MDTALRTDDLIREIFTHLRLSAEETPGELEDYPGAGTLYNAALSCKGFSSHALDALWFASYNLAPLMRLIPNSKRAGSEGICLIRPLKNGDLSTFDRYAKRIKEYYEFNWEASTRYRIPVMLDLLQCLKRTHLLPNLRRLYIRSVDMYSEPPDWHSFLLCPNLLYLKLLFQDEGHIKSVFPRIVRLAPHLRRLEIMDPSIPEYLLPLISHFHSLQELSAPNDFIVSSDTFSSTSPFADQLEIWCLGSIAINPKDLSRTQFLGSSGHQFSALTGLTLQAPKSIRAISEVFAHNLFPRLETLVLSARYEFTDGSNGGWAKLFSALFSRKNCLQHITVYHWGDPTMYRFNPGETDIFASLANSEPQDLKELIVELPLKKSLPASSIQGLISIFPYLTTLHIATSRILFEDLALLAQGLPHLLDLCVGVNGRKLPHPDDIHTTLPLLSHGLESIFLQNSDIGHPVVFARWLDRLFPIVTVITVNVSPNVPEMAEILYLMRPIRMDQDARINQQIN